MKKPSYSLRVSEFIKSPRAKVFKAWVDPDLMKKWFCPEGLRPGKVEADIRVGGKFRGEMIAPDATYTAMGTYQEIIPNEKIVFSHGWEGEEYHETQVTILFKDKDGGTEIILTHEGLLSKESAKGHEEGWRSTLQNWAKAFTQ